MELVYDYEPFYPLECAAVLMRSIAPESTSKDSRFLENVNSFMKNCTRSHPSCIDKIDKMLDVYREISGYMMQNIKITPEKLNFYFLLEENNIFCIGHAIAALELNCIDTSALKPEIRHSVLSNFLQSCIYPGSEQQPVLNEAAFVSWLNAQDISTDDKWRCMLFYTNAEIYQQECRQILCEAKELYCDKRELWQPVLKECIDSLKISIEAGTDFTKQLFSIKLLCDKIKVQPSIAWFNSLTITSFSVDELPKGEFDSMLVGYMIEFLLSLDSVAGEAEERLSSQLKAISDIRRLKILTALKKHSLCGQEIAQLMGITPATVSHHMNELVNNSFVELAADGTKVNYRFSENGLEKLISGLKDTFLS